MKATVTSIQTEISPRGRFTIRTESCSWQNTENGMVFNDDPVVRRALMHITGDKDNNISTGANRAFTDEFIGYDFINGVYTLNNAGEDVTLTLDSGVCAAAYEALDGRSGTVGVYNMKREIICMVSSPTYDPQDPPAISSMTRREFT